MKQITVTIKGGLVTDVTNIPEDTSVLIKDYDFRGGYVNEEDITTDESGEYVSSLWGNTETNPLWTKSDSAEAQKQGWDIAKSGKEWCLYTTGKLPTDREAWKFVLDNVNKGDWLAIKAISVLALLSPNEMKDIREEYEQKVKKK